MQACDGIIVLQEAELTMVTVTVTPTEPVSVSVNVIQECIPPGGTIGQVLTKRSNLDFDAWWQDAPSASGAEIAFETFQDMVDAPSAIWSHAQVWNYDPDDGVYSEWSKTSAPYTANEFNIVRTTDGALIIRTLQVFTK